MELIKSWHYSRFKRLQSVRVESHFGWKANTLGFSLSCSRSTEDTFQFVLGIPLLFLLYLTVDFSPWKWWRRMLGKAPMREVIHIHLCNQYLNLALWHDIFDHTKGELNGFSYIKSWKDLLCGDFALVDEDEVWNIMDYPAVPHLHEPNGIQYAKWRITRTRIRVVWERWYMRLWSRVKPTRYTTYRVEPFFTAGFPGKNGADDHLVYLNVTTVDTPEAAIDHFNERLTELQTRY